MRYFELTLRSSRNQKPQLFVINYDGSDSFVFINKSKSCNSHL